jgi:hypothetical protein
MPIITLEIIRCTFEFGQEQTYSANKIQRAKVRGSLIHSSLYVAYAPIRDLPATCFYCCPATVLEWNSGYVIFMPPVAKLEPPVPHLFPLFGFNTLIDFFSMNGHLFWSINTNSDLISLCAEYGYRDLITDHQCLTDSPCKY